MLHILYILSRQCYFGGDIQGKVVQHFLNYVKQVMDQQKHNCLISREYFKIQKILLRP